LRADLEFIAGMIESGSKVLDVGCGNGDLLAYLEKHKNVDGRGIEISHTGVRMAVELGLSVIQGDADEDLKHYPDKIFDYAILSQTLQATEKPKEVLRQIVRISRRAIISVPNFGYWKNRMYLLCRGCMPETAHLPYKWYETPNIHFCTLRDFIILADDLDIKINKSFTVSGGGALKKFNAKAPGISNLTAEFGLFVVECGNV